jgi:hypothetical protein
MKPPMSSAVFDHKSSMGVPPLDFLQKTPDETSVPGIFRQYMIGIWPVTFNPLARNASDWKQKSAPSPICSQVHPTQPRFPRASPAFALHISAL